MILKTVNASENEALFFEKRRVGEWLTSQEAAQFLGITPNAIRIMVCRGKIKSWKLGRRLRFRSDELAALLQKGA